MNKDEICLWQLPKIQYYDMAEHKQLQDAARKFIKEEEKAVGGSGAAEAKGGSQRKEEREK